MEKLGIVLTGESNDLVVEGLQNASGKLYYGSGVSRR